MISSNEKDTYGNELNMVYYTNTENKKRLRLWNQNITFCT